MSCSVPHVGQWCDANSTSECAAYRLIDSVRYFDHTCGSRTSAPRNVSRLCSVWVAFSAMHSARRSGK